jgi:hypothetical protein
MENGKCQAAQSSAPGIRGGFDGIRAEQTYFPAHFRSFTKNTWIQSFIRVSDDCIFPCPVV